MSIKKKVIITIVAVVALCGAIGLSYAKFVPVQIAGNRNINTIMGNTLSATDNSPNIVVTYDESTPYIDTGDLILTTDPLNEIVKFKVSTISTNDVYVETSFSTVKNTLTTAGTYNLYECSETNYNQATYANVSTNCTSIGKTTGNSLPTAGVKVFIHENRSITVPAGGTKYLAFTYSIPASNNEKRYIGVLNTNLKDMTWFDFTYTGTFIDSRVDGIGPIYFTSDGTLTVTNGKTDVDVEIIGAGGGGGGQGGHLYYTWPNGTSHSTAVGGTGGGGGSGYHTTLILDVVNGTYDFTIGIGGTGGASGENGYDDASDDTSEDGTAGSPGSRGSSTIAFGQTINPGNGGSGGHPGTNYGSTMYPGSNGYGGVGQNNGTSKGVGGAGFRGYGAGGNTGSSTYPVRPGGNGQNGAVILTFN